MSSQEVSEELIKGNFAMEFYDSGLYNLIIEDDDKHTKDHFFYSIKLAFPDYEDKIINNICKLVNKYGSSKCTIDHLERIEFYKEKLSKYGINCRIEKFIRRKQ